MVHGPLPVRDQSEHWSSGWWILDNIITDEDDTWNVDMNAENRTERTSKKNKKQSSFKDVQINWY